MGTEPEASSVVLLITFTWLLSFAPSEAYLVPFLTRVKHLSAEQVSIGIFPFGVYGTLAFTVLAAPACSVLTHRGVIILGTFAKLATFVLLYYGESMLAMRCGQLAYGLAMASSLVFTSYVFGLFPEEDFQKMTSYTQASSLASFLMAAEIGQLLVDRGASLETQLQITLVFAVLSCAVSFLLPREGSGSGETGLLGRDERGLREAVWAEIGETWRGENLRLLSFWWVMGTAAFAMILNYGTNLFHEIDPASNSYGHVIAASQGLASLGSLAAVRAALLAERNGGTFYVIGTFLAGVLCVIMGGSDALSVVYPTYVAAIGINQLLLCLIYVQCAKALSSREFVLLFSFNAVAALLVQSAIQFSVEALKLSIADQFFVFGGYCMAVALVFGLLCHEHSLRTGMVELVPRKDDTLVLL